MESDEARNLLWNNFLDSIPSVLGVSIFLCTLFLFLAQVGEGEPRNKKLEIWIKTYLFFVGFFLVASFGINYFGF
jgi:hypothetical protein